MANVKNKSKMPKFEYKHTEYGTLYYDLFRGSYVMEVSEHKIVGKRVGNNRGTSKFSIQFFTY